MLVDLKEVEGQLVFKTILFYRFFLTLSKERRDKTTLNHLSLSPFVRIINNIDFFDRHC